MLFSMDFPISTFAAFVVLAGTIAWIYLWLCRCVSRTQRRASETWVRVSSLDDKIKAIGSNLSDLQAQLSNIYERQTYLRASQSDLQMQNDAVQTELTALMVQSQEVQARKVVTNKKLLDAVEQLAEQNLTSLETQFVTLQRLQADLRWLREKVEKIEGAKSQEVSRDGRTVANRP
jgi:chromosome segregation ATPase